MNRRRLIFWFASATVILLLALSLLSHPAVTVRVVDAAGKPVAGAIIKGEGLGTKRGPGAGGWTSFGWGPALDPPRPKTIITGRDGTARVPYPGHLSKGVETGTIKLLVDHPDFVPNHSEQVVAIALPRGFNWDLWKKYLAQRFARNGPIIMQKGAILAVNLRKDSPEPRNAPLYVQVAGWENEDTNVWVHPEPGVALSRRLPVGTQNVRAVAFDTNGCAWFSDLLAVNVVSGQTNELSVVLKRGATVHGTLDAIVPRPATSGRVTASVWPKNVPQRWHTWAAINADGTFEIGSLPPGELELVAVCDGFVSANTKGEYSAFHYPQRYSFGTNDITINLAMEPTATLDVEVTDDHGKALKNAKVFAGSTVKYGGDEGTTMLGTDCFHTADLIRDGRSSWLRVEPIVLAALTNNHPTTDSRGRALIRNLPIEISVLDIQHQAYVLPEIDIGSKPTRYNLAPQKLRVAKVSLVANQTNHTVVRLERRQ